ncbi:MAG: DUF6542 domain-containing protein [Nocardioidaceae bacterium]
MFDRTAFEDDGFGQERDDLVLEPIVVERPAVSYPREPAPTQVTQTTMYLAESPPGRRSRPPAYERAPAYLREPDPTHVPRPRAAGTYPPPTTSRSRRAPPSTPTPAPRSTQSHRRRESAGLETSLGRGIPGRGIILLGHTAAFSVAAVDIALNHELTLFFSLGFILIGLLCALSVRRSDLFTAGVLPPLLLAVVVGVFAIAMPSAVGAPSGSISHAWVAGLAHNAGGLVSAHAAALLMIALRMLNEPARRTRAF